MPGTNGVDTKFEAFSSLPGIKYNVEKRTGRGQQHVLHYSTTNINITMPNFVLNCMKYFAGNN